MTVRLIGNRLHPESRDGHAGKADNHQNEFEETVSVLDRHRCVVLADQCAAYEMGDAIVDSGHFRVDDVQNGHIDECTCRQGVEAGFDQCGGMMPPAMPTARIDRRATTLIRISHQDAPVLSETGYFQTVMSPFGGWQRNRQCWACPGWSFFLQRAHAPSTVETATLFGREHALEKKILRHDHAPW